MPVPALKVRLTILVPKSLTLSIAFGVRLVGASLSLKKLKLAPNPNRLYTSEKF